MQNPDPENLVELPADASPLAGIAPPFDDPPVTSAGLDTIFSADFFSGPGELFFSALAILGVFILVTGLMLNLATELTEEGDWFFWGVGIPSVLATYTVGWALFGVWTMATVIVMLFQKGRAVHWFTVLPGAILVMTAGLTIIYGVMPPPQGRWFLPLAPWLLILLGSMLALRLSWRSYSKWLFAISLPAAARYSLSQLPVERSFQAIEIFNIAALCLAGGLILIVPLTLAFRRKEQCLRPLLAGSSLFLAGSAIVAVTLVAHYSYFAN